MLPRTISKLSRIIGQICAVELEYLSSAHSFSATFENIAINHTSPNFQTCGEVWLSYVWWSPLTAFEKKKKTHETKIVVGGHNNTKWKLVKSHRRTVDQYAFTVFDHLFGSCFLFLKTQSARGRIIESICASVGSNPFSGTTAIELTLFLWPSLADADLWPGNDFLDIISVMCTR